ncbi:hypothetical protein EVG20_g3253 [Dentipellis fragilis]|uniref:Right handed beta helix domain-containing protein n=1 Tax=Dentipellis fragilis TaxID=205917 RepID=A0A4Y9Z720_9AGAM|nr:hypothetical protein EVG20_g3253 [Dentipellis fragilis]
MSPFHSIVFALFALKAVVGSSSAFSDGSATLMKHNTHRRVGELFQDSSASLDIRDDSDCISPDPQNTVTDRMNIALNTSGPGYILKLCQNTQYFIVEPIKFAAPNQEISTVGYPTGDERAVLVVNGPVADGQGHTTAIDGTCSNCSYVKLRNIQVNGTRGGASPTGGGANIEMGGPTSGQIIEYVRSHDPRSWSCLHIAEGGLLCNNVTVQNNDIGPCGTDAFQEWADGISVSCASAVVRNNLINNPTDGGVVLFGAPGTLVENNTIWVVNNTCLGGINMVDVDPWGGNYTGTVVQHNIITGGFATDSDSAYETKGSNVDDVIVKIGIAIGPRAWFGDRYGDNVSFSGTVLNNQFTGAFGYGIAVTSSRNFTVQGNTLVGNTSFLGSRGPNCTSDSIVPTPAPLIVDSANVSSPSLQSDFQTIQDQSGLGLTCILPPDGGDFWPYGGNPAPNSMDPPVPVPEPAAHAKGNNGLSGGAKAGIAIGVILGVVALSIVVWFIRNWALRRAALKTEKSGGQTGYVQSY